MSYETKNTNKNLTINHCLFCSTNFKVIMRNKPTLEEVKEHFKDADIIKELTNHKPFNINKQITKGVHEWKEGYWIDTIINSAKLWDYKLGYAEILYYKKNKPIKTVFTITKKQILQAHNAGFIRIKEWFPEAFKTELEVDFTGWAKCKTSNKWIVYFENGVFKYGIDSEGKWFEKSDYYNFKAGKSEFEATTQEVETAIESEIERRYKIGCRIKCLNNGDIKEVYSSGNIDYYAGANDAYYDGVQVFDNGKWAQIITTISREEAEKRLGVKIE